MGDANRLSAMRLLHVDHVLPGDAAPIEDAAVLVDADGTVHDVGRAADLVPRHAGLPIERIAGVVFPGLVNAHAHLELSALSGRVPGGSGFTAWVDALVAARLEHAPDDDARAIEVAVDALVAAGTAAVGEVTNRLGAVHALARAGIAGTIFHEIFGVAREGALRHWEGLAADVVRRVGRWPTPDLAYAPAAHTLYTTHPDAVRAVTTRAKERGVRTSLHLLEHAEERAAIETGEGAMVAWIAKRVRGGGGFAWPRVPLLTHAESLDAIGEHVLLVHLTEARPDELARIAASRAHVVLCPRSNQHIERRSPPVAQLRALGVEAALGTDSLASSPSLDVLAEARAVADLAPEIPPVALVAMATWNGARALGRADLGRIAPGSRPGLVAVDGPVTGDPAARVLASSTTERRWIARRVGRADRAPDDPGGPPRGFGLSS